MTERTVLGHPAGLFVLFISEACERFSYYGMRALIALYLIEHFFFKDGTAFGVVAAYGSMVYLMPIIGGFLADRYIGFRKAIVLGNSSVLRSLLMAYEGEAAQVIDGMVQQDEFALDVMFLALSFIIVGVGFLKPLSQTWWVSFTRRTIPGETKGSRSFTGNQPRCDFLYFDLWLGARVRLVNGRSRGHRHAYRTGFIFIRQT